MSDAHEYSCGDPLECFEQIAILLNSINDTISKQSLHPFKSNVSVSEICLIILTLLFSYLTVISTWFVLGSKLGDQPSRLSPDVNYDAELTNPTTQEDRQQLL